MFNYRPLAKTMKEKGKGTEDIAKVLKMSLEEVKDKLNNNRNITMAQLGRLCDYFDCGPGEIMSWSPDGDLVKVDWNKVASHGKPLMTLSIECGLSRSAFTNAKNCNCKIKIENAKKLAEVLDCSIEELIKGE